MKIKLKQYKGIDLYYEENNGKIHFDFEGQHRIVNYVFEAISIIDEPLWEKCDMKGYFVDGYIDKYIGLAKALRKNKKTGKPDWFIKGQYSLEYKKPNFDEPKVFLKTKENDDVYKKWECQRDIYNQELRKLNDITNLLNKN